MCFDDEEIVCKSFAKSLHALMQDNACVLPGQVSAVED